MAQLTLDVPRPVLERLKKSAKSARRGIEDEIVQILRLAISIDDDAPYDVEGVVSGLRFLTDPELRKVAHPARIRKTAKDLASLNDKCQREGRLSHDENQSRDQLQSAIDRFVLIRAEALCLLQQRGRDVSGLLKT